MRLKRLTETAPAPEDFLSHPSDPDREKQEVIPIIAALVVAIAPHVTRLPLWINLWCFIMWGYMLLRLKTGWPLPRPAVRYFLAFLGIAGLLATFRSGIGGDAFVGLMALMAAIKPFEMPTHRHKMITILLTYFIIITSLFRSDSLFIVLYMLFSVFVTTTTMIRINAPDSSLEESRKLAGTILAQAIPLVMVLFLVFPRLPDSLFGFQDPTRGKTGFFESMKPGQVTAMAQDQTPAFRAEFESGIPPADQLYWRGVVFQNFDGRTWRPLADRGFWPSKSGEKPEQQGKTISYTILMAPHQSRWLMALDRPVKGPTWAALGKDHSLKARQKITKKTQYKAVSRLPGLRGGWPDSPGHHERSPESVKALPRAVTGNKHMNPRTRQLVREMTARPGTPGEMAGRLLAYFRENNFVYSLNPPPVGPHSVDSFVFDARNGYCEHYASAFAFMMNAAGIPARVVGGYLGGELNPYGGYLIIRQSYAHAWVEYFDENTGWTRVDPTSVVAPERLTTNPDGTTARPGPAGSSLSFLNKMRFAVDAVNLTWESWFTGYSYFEQKAWLTAMGLVRGNKATAAALAFLTLCGTGLFSGILIWRFKRKKIRPDPVALTYTKFIQKLSRLGLIPEPGQGPVEFARYCTGRRPDLAPDIQLIMDLYVSLRYKKEIPEKALSGFQTRVKKFRPRKKERL